MHVRSDESVQQLNQLLGSVVIHGDCQISSNAGIQFLCLSQHCLFHFIENVFNVMGIQFFFDFLIGSGYEAQLFQGKRVFFQPLYDLALRVFEAFEKDVGRFVRLNNVVFETLGITQQSEMAWLHFMNLAGEDVIQFFFYFLVLIQEDLEIMGSDD